MPAPAVLRLAAGLVVTAVVASLGALILGEYELVGTLPLVAGALLGVALGEVVLTVGRSRHPGVAVVVAAMAFGAMAWAGWISSGRGLQPVTAGTWWGGAVGALAGFVRVVGLPGRGRRPAG